MPTESEQQENKSPEKGLLNRSRELTRELEKIRNPPGPEVIDAEIVSVKRYRVALDAVLQDLKASAPSRERSLAITKIQEAIMWCGMDLKRLGELKPKPILREVLIDQSRNAQAAYARYGAVTGFKNFRGDPMPKWEDLGETIQKAWTAAANAQQPADPTDTRPYPNSYDPTNTKVDPTADGLKL